AAFVGPFTGPYGEGMSRVDFLRDVGQRGVWAIVRLAITFPLTTLFIAVMLAVLSIWYTSHHLEFQTSRNALVSQKARYIQHFEEIDQDFYDLDSFIAVIEAPHLERGKQFVNALVPRLRADTQHFNRVIDRIDTSSLEGKKLLLLSPEDLHTLQQRLQEAQTFLTDLAAAPGLQQLLTSVNQELSKALVSLLAGSFLGNSTSSTAEPGQALDVTFLSALFGEIEQALAAPAAYVFRSPWASFFLKDSKILSQEGYLTSGSDRFLFVLVEDSPPVLSFVMLVCHTAPCG